MKHYKLLFVFIASLSASTVHSQGCTYDTQCKGNRICQGGVCVASDSNQSPNSSSGTTPTSTGDGLSSTCQFSNGPRAGQVQHWPRNTPGLTPVPVGQSCTDGVSYGVAIPDE
jgi:hypothetical protein